MLHFAERQIRMGQQMGAAKAQVPRMPSHVEEGNRAGPALRRVHPVAYPWVIANVAFAAIPDVEAVQCVIKDGQPDAEKFKKEYERKAAQEFNLLGVCAGPFRREGIGDKV